MQAEHPGRQAERLLATALATPGLFARWSRGAPPDSLPGAPPGLLPELRRRVAEPAALASGPARDWPAPLLELWRAGIIFLVDERSRLGEPLVLSARRLVLRESSLGPFSSVIGDGVLLERSVVRNHTSLEGLLALVETIVHPYVALGPNVVAEKSAFQPFSKAQRGVRVARSLIGSHTAIDGGNHPERIPLGPRRRVLGAQIGPDAWIGQHVSVTAGAIIGAGVVVAPHTAVSTPVGEHVMLSGSPARAHPIDFNIRGLSADEARREGRAQGSMAVDLPIFGPHRGALRDPRCLEIDFPEHGVLRGLASENLLHFQAGVLESALAQLFPDHRAEVGFQTGATVRFTVRFEPPLARHVAPAPDVVVTRTAAPVGDGLGPEHHAVLDRLGRDPIELKTLLPPSGQERFMAVLSDLALRGHVEPAFFRPGPPSGMLELRLDPKALARLFDHLAGWDAPPLPPFQPATPAPAPAPASVAPPAPAPPPARAGTLALLTSMLQELLATKADIDVDAPFYALGIDSLTAADLATRLEQELHIAAPDVFAHNSVRLLAEAVERVRHD